MEKAIAIIAAALMAVVVSACSIEGRIGYYGRTATDRRDFTGEAIDRAERVRMKNAINY